MSSEPHPPLPPAPPSLPQQLAPAPAPYAGAWPGYPPPEARPPRVWTVFVAYLAAFLGGSLAGGLVGVALTVVRHGPEALTPSPEDPDRGTRAMMTDPVAFLPMLFTIAASLATVAVAGAVLSPVPFRRRLRLGMPKLRWYGYPIILLGTVALAQVFTIGISLLHLENEGILKHFSEAISAMQGPMLVIASLVIGLSPGFGEELLFRGYMQTRLTHRWGRWASVVITSVLFGVIHMDVIQGTFAAALGLWVGLIVERTGSIWPAILCHTVNNSVATAVSSLVPPSQPGGVVLPLTLAGGVLVLCVVYVLAARPVPVEEPLLRAPWEFD